jgi:hypothetical protein
LPALIAGASKLVQLVIPAAQHGPLAQRYLLSLAGPVTAEWVFVITAFLILERRHEPFREFGIGGVDRGQSDGSEWKALHLFRGDARLARRSHNGFRTVGILFL